MQEFSYFLHFQHVSYDYVLYRNECVIDSARIFRIHPDGKSEELVGQERYLYDIKSFAQSKENSRGSLVTTTVVVLNNNAKAYFTAVTQGYHRAKKNNRSFHRNFNFDACHDLLNNETKERTSAMNTKEMITILQLENGAKVISANYLENTGGVYHFKNVLGLNLALNDLVVVETRDTFALVRVVNPDVAVSDVGCPLEDLKHVVAAVNNDHYMNTKQREANAVRQLALSEVTSRLNTYREQVGNQTYNTVAALFMNDPVVVDSDDN